MSMSKILLLVGVGAVSAAAGVAIPLVMSGGTKVAKADAASEATEPADAHASEKALPKADSHGKADSHTKTTAKKEHGADKADAHGKEGGGHAGEAAASGPQFVPFGRIVVNLNEPALTKYLSLDITLLTDGKDKASVSSAVEDRLPILRTWLTSYLADKSMEDVRGKVGINRLRREIQDQFNALMFDDGRERVRDVLFEEFHVE
jgi:flagellar basal body-associated protein FliL